MLTKAFGEVVTNVLTTNPVLAEIESASAILDVSNYTFQAVTLGKDADGFNYHAHTVSSTQYINDFIENGVSGYNDGKLIVINYGADQASSASSYIFSATEIDFSSTYSSLPCLPTPYDTRLERASTSTTALSDFPTQVPDLGHYANPAKDSDLSAIWNVMGGFPPSGHTDEFLFFSAASSTATPVFLFGGTLSSLFNEEGLVDKDGYIRFSEASIEASPNYRAGACLASGVDFQPNQGSMKIGVILHKGDAAAIAGFGGVKHLGVYCLDLQGMLDAGLRPPFSWDHINNNWQYKLVAKSTTVDNALWHQDGDASAPIITDDSGFNHVLNDNLLSGLVAAFALGGPLLSMSIEFK